MRSPVKKIDLYVVVLLLAGLPVFVIKCWIIYPIEYIGHGDAADYAEMADSLIHGRGFSVDYISFYFLKYPKIVRPEDHWPPLYSIAIAPFFLIFGKTAFAAKLPSVIISCFLLPLVIYFLGKELSGNKFVGMLAAFSVLSYLPFFTHSLYCYSDITCAFVVCATVLFSIKGLKDGKFFYPMGIFMGLAHYAKGSCIILIPGYVLFYIICRRGVKTTLNDRKFLIGLFVAFLVMLPWFIRNYVHFHNPLFSTQQYTAGYVGYEEWDKGTYPLFWGENLPSFMSKFRLGIGYVAKMTWEHFKNYLWWLFMDMHSGWGKFSRYAPSTYLTGVPALLGTILFLRNKKTYIIKPL